MIMFTKLLTLTVALKTILAQKIQVQETHICSTQSCDFDCRDGRCQSSALVCTNTVQNCRVDCSTDGACENVAIYSGATHDTQIICAGKDACIDSYFFCGGFAADHAPSAKVKNTLIHAQSHKTCDVLCGDAACVNTLFECYGNFEDGCYMDLVSEYEHKSQLEKSRFNCYSDKLVNCHVNCGDYLEAQSCEALHMDCFGEGTCECYGINCIDVIQKMHSISPTKTPTLSPTPKPSKKPSVAPSFSPTTLKPSKFPSFSPSRASESFDEKILKESEEKVLNWNLVSKAPTSEKSKANLVGKGNVEVAHNDFNAGHYIVYIICAAFVCVLFVISVYLLCCICRNINELQQQTKDSISKKEINSQSGYVSSAAVAGNDIKIIDL